MTFKHITFDESPVMRQLLKQAAEKEETKTDVVSEEDDITTLQIKLDKATNEAGEIEKAMSKLSPPHSSGTGLAAILKNMYEDKVQEITDLIDKIDSLTDKEANKESDSENDLFKDMLNLVSGLCSKGFKKEAEELEDSILAFKLAETHLYRAIDEDGEDLLNFAHPGSDITISDAKDGHGKVENLISQHKKIVDVVKKEPTGKLASVLDGIAADLGLKKKAQVRNKIVDHFININATIENLKKFVSEISQARYFINSDGTFHIGVRGKIADQSIPLIRSYLNNGAEVVADGKVASMAIEFYRDATNITDLMWKSFLAGSQDWSFGRLFSKENINSANAQLNQIMHDYLIKKIASLNPGSVPDLKNLESVNTAKANLVKLINNIKGIFDNYSLFTIKILTNFNGELENKFRNEYIPSILNQANEAIAALDARAKELQPKGNEEVLSSWWAANLAGKFDRLSQIAAARKHPAANEFKQIANIIKSNVNQPFSKVHTALVALDPNNAPHIDKHKLDVVAMNWENYFRSKVAKVNNKITKEAVPSNPLEYEKQQVAAPKAQPAAPKAQQPVKQRSARRQSPEEYNAVLAMQYSLHALADALARPNVYQLAGLNRDQVDAFIRNLKGTGPGSRRHEDAPDGKWGPNTKRSLETANQLVQQIKKINPNLIKEEVGFQTAPSQNAVEQAKGNRSIIDSVLMAVGAEDLVKSDNKTVDASVYDNVPNGINVVSNDVFSTANQDGEIPLKVNDISTFTTFQDFIVKNRLTNVDPVNGYPYDNWENALKYFLLRSYLKVKREPENKTYQKYHSGMKALYNAFRTKISRIPKDKLESTLITAVQLDMEAIEGVKNRTEERKPAAMTGRDAGEGIDVEYSPQISQDLMQQPIGYYINLRALAHAYPDDMTGYNSFYGQLMSRKLQINVQEFRQDPKVLADSILRDPTVNDLMAVNPNLTRQHIEFFHNYPSHATTMSYMADAKLRMLSKIIISMRADLMRVIDTYESNMYKVKMDPRAVQATNTAWSAWSNAFTQLINRIGRSLQKIDAGGSNRYYSY